MTKLRKGQVRLGPQTWVLIRQAYLSGASAASLAETYGCSLGTIRYRAVREGWRRCDLEDAPAHPAPADPPDAPPPTPDALADAAMSAALRAVRSGRPSEAAAYVRVAEAARRMAGAGGGEAWDKADDGPFGREPEAIEDVYRDLDERLVELRAMYDHKRAAEAEGQAPDQKAGSIRS